MTTVLQQKKMSKEDLKWSNEMLELFTKNVRIAKTEKERAKAKALLEQFKRLRFYEPMPVNPECFKVGPKKR
jgi:hypothetical protein